MQSVLAFGALGVGAYLVTKSTREQLEALSDIQSLAADVKPSRVEDDLLAIQKTIAPGRENFLAGQDIVIPDSAQNPVPSIPKYYNFPRKEQLSIQEPELGNTDLTLPVHSTTYMKDRVGAISTGTQKDFVDAQGKIVDTFSTGQQIPLRQTPIEVIVEQTPVADYWKFDPHVVRVNDDENVRFSGSDQLSRAVAVSPYWQSLARPKPKDTLRRPLEEETAWLRPTLSNAVGYSTSRPFTVDMGTDKDRTIAGNHTTITPYYGRSLYPRIMENPVAEYERKNEYSPTPLITPQWDGPSGVHFLETTRSRNKSDTYDNSHATRAGVAPGQGWRQVSIDTQFRRLGDDPENVRQPELASEQSPYTGYVKPQYESRKPGLSIQDVGTWTPAFVRNIMDKFTKPPPTGLAPAAAVSSSIADNPQGDIEQQDSKSFV